MLSFNTPATDSFPTVLRTYTVNPIKLETGLRPNSAGIPYTLLLRIEAIGVSNSWASTARRTCAAAVRARRRMEYLSERLGPLGVEGLGF